MATIGVRNEQSAMDIVQDAMMRLAEKYGHRSESEWPMLFQRILQNAILDHHRRQRVRRTWVSLFGDLFPEKDDETDKIIPDSILEMAADPKLQPEELLERGRTRDRIESAIGELPVRQQQAFLLRYWEGLDIAQTAAVMGCSEGSVKTHCFRAMKTLEQALAEIRPSGGKD
jgi:RNA polymerase sigma-70 factor (ECF subfamily)